MRRLKYGEIMKKGDKMYYKDGSLRFVVDGWAGNKVSDTISSIEAGGWVERDEESTNIEPLISALRKLRKEIKQWKND